MAVTPGGTPYVESSDLVANYPAVSLALAEHIDDLPNTIGQIVSTVKTDTFTTTSGSFVDVTGLSVSITPATNTNKVMLIVMMNAAVDPGQGALQAITLRNSTQIALGDADGSRTRATWPRFVSYAAGANAGVLSMVFIDSPATTSATTYKIQIRQDAGGTVPIYVNRVTTDNDSALFARGISTITAIEVTA